MAETSKDERARAWGEWLSTELAKRAWKQADLVRNSGGTINADRVSKWVNGVEGPSHRFAVYLANTLNLPVADVLATAGFDPVEYVAGQSNLVAMLEANAEADRKKVSLLHASRDLRHLPDSVLAEELLRRARKREGFYDRPDVGGSGESDNLHEVDLRNDLDAAASEDDSSVDPTRGES